jgi:hypothetical protein
MTVIRCTPVTTRASSRHAAGGPGRALPPAAKGRNRRLVGTEAAVVVGRLGVLVFVDVGQPGFGGGAQAQGLMHEGADGQGQQLRVRDRDKRGEGLANPAKCRWAGPKLIAGNPRR